MLVNLLIDAPVGTRQFTPSHLLHLINRNRRRQDAAFIDYRDKTNSEVDSVLNDILKNNGSTEVSFESITHCPNMLFQHF